jgi:hypothetical protein
MSGLGACDLRQLGTCRIIRCKAITSGQLGLTVPNAQCTGKGPRRHPQKNSLYHTKSPNKTPLFLWCFKAPHAK